MYFYVSLAWSLIIRLRAVPLFQRIPSRGLRKNQQKNHTNKMWHTARTLWKMPHSRNPKVPRGTLATIWFFPCFSFRQGMPEVYLILFKPARRSCYTNRFIFEVLTDVFFGVSTKCLAVWIFERIFLETITEIFLFGLYDLFPQLVQL